MKKTLLTFLSALLLLTLLTSCASLLTYKNKKSWTLEALQSQELRWKTCYESFQCATLIVPVDYNAIGEDVFNLEVLRYKATDQRNRIGSLIVNPGGPGASAVEYAYAAEFIVGPEILAKYDIVGFDQRGVGFSEPIRCLTDKETDAAFESGGTLNTPKEINEAIEFSKSFAEKCAQAAGNKLGHLSTLESAKDMDLLRRALGDEKLNYLGKSYGTFLGTLYAGLFPGSVGRMVLDGAVDPTIPESKQALIQAIGFEGALNSFLKKYKISKATVLELLKKINKEPILTSDKRKVSDSLFILGMASAMYDNIDGWPRLNKAILAALHDNGVPILKLADEYTTRDTKGHYLTNENDISTMISCLDTNERKTLKELTKGKKLFESKAPVFGPYLAYSGLGCNYWKATPPLPEFSLKKITTTPILIIGVTRDPATPYEWAVGLHKTITNSRLITLVGDGHTGHNRGNTCVDSAVNAYLLTAETPSKNVICYS